MSALNLAEPVLEPWRPRLGVELLRAQLAALDLWNDDRAAQEQRLDLAAESREQRQDLARRLDGLRAEQEALHRRAALHQNRGMALVLADQPRVVVAHRQQWFRDRVFADFAARDVTVVASEDNGAECLAATIYDQPDVLVIEDLLPTITGREVLERVHRFAPDTVVAVQAMHLEQAPALVDAGASLVLGRRVPPDVLVQEVVTFLHQPHDAVVIA